MSYDVSYHNDNYQPQIGDGDHEDNSFLYGGNNRNAVEDENLSATCQSRHMNLDDITQHDGNQVNSVY